MSVKGSTDEAATFVIPESEKLSIYDDEPARSIIRDKPIPLETSIRKTRHLITSAFQGTKEQTQRVVDHWINWEQRIRSKILNVASPHEQFLPGALYVTISTLGGMLIAKRRGVLGRILIPSGFSMISFVYLYPATSRNLFNKVLLELNRESNRIELNDPNIKEKVRRIENMYTTRGNAGIESLFTKKDQGKKE